MVMGFVLTYIPREIVQFFNFGSSHVERKKDQQITLPFELHFNTSHMFSTTFMLSVKNWILRITYEYKFSTLQNV